MIIQDWINLVLLVAGYIVLGFQAWQICNLDKHLARRYPLKPRNRK